MALRKSVQAAARVSASPVDAVSVVPAYAEYVTVAGQFAAADVIEMIHWPAGTILSRLRAVIPDLDSNGSPALTLDFGILSGLYGAELDEAFAARTCGVEFGNNLTTGQAGGNLDIATDVLLALAPSAKERSIGFKVEVAPATLVAGARIRVIAEFVPAPPGVTITS